MLAQGAGSDGEGDGDDGEGEGEEGGEGSGGDVTEDIVTDAANVDSPDAGKVRKRKGK